MCAAETPSERTSLRLRYQLDIEAEEVQHRHGDDPADSRARIRKAVERRDTTLT